MNAVEIANHWNEVYDANEREKQGWYEQTPSPALEMIQALKLAADAHILLAGAGTTSLAEALLRAGYSHMTFTDISEVALRQLKELLPKNEHFQFIIDDLTDPGLLNDLEPVDLWVDRAVLHFFLIDEEKEAYSQLIHEKVKSGGYVLLAEFSLEGAEKCSGLTVNRYSEAMLKEFMGDDFELIQSMPYSYTNPAGGKRPYIYTLFRRR